MRTIMTLSLFLVLICADAQISLLKDINTESIDAQSPIHITDVNGTAFFFMTDPNNGYELWKSDGTSAGTVLVKDVYPGTQGSVSTGGSNAGDFAAANGLFFFVASHPIFGREVWRSDGTEAGTHVLKDIIPGAGGTTPKELIALGNQVFFIHTDAAAGQEIFVTDGTESGTHVFVDMRPGTTSSSPGELTRMNNEIYFRANNGVLGVELWKTDVSVAGTVLVKDIYVGNVNSNSYPDNLIVVNDRIFFSAQVNGTGGTGRELWVTDGTDAGTQLVADLTPGTANSTFYDDAAGLGDTLYFRFDGDTTGQELWRSDGTAAGTSRMLDINPGTAQSYPQKLATAGGKLFFRATDLIHGNDVWVSDGTAAGTISLDINPGTAQSFFDSPMEFNGQLFFEAAGPGGFELWKSDGTISGTEQVTDVPGNASADYMTEVNGSLFFRAYDPAVGNELFISDGTTLGTSAVEEAPLLNDSSDPEQFVDINGITFFVANDGIHGEELWRSDGTEAGTYMLKDIRPGTSSPGIEYMAVLNGEVYFAANDGVSGVELWKSDGTAVGTVLFMDLQPGGGYSYPRFMTEAGGKLYFQSSAFSGTQTGWEPWVSDGTVAGTFMLKDIRAGTSSSNASGFTAMNGLVYFSATEDATGQELWVTDGTSAGTQLVVDAYPGTSSGLNSSTELVVMNNELFFASFIGDGNGTELYKTNGSTGNISLVKDIYTGSPSSQPQDLIVFNNKLYFEANVPSEGGRVLYQSDGTDAGTVLVKDINTVSTSTDITNMTVVGGTLYFTAFDGIHGTELWRTDGTDPGTVMVLDINPGPSGSDPSDLLDDNGLLFFLAENLTDGRGVYTSDGTASNTTRISTPGTGDVASNLTSAQGGFYFRGANQVTGYEPYYLDRGASADLRILLEGPYDTNSALMKDDLRIAGLVPTTEPFSGLGFTMVNSGGETIDPSVLSVAGNDAIVDWVLIELRDAVDPTVITLTVPALLQRDGAVVNLDGTSSPSIGAAGSIAYLAIRHRNHLGVMTAAPVNFNGSSIVLDLTDPVTQTFGTNGLKNMNGINLLWSGNVFNDGAIKYVGQNNDRDVILVEIGGNIPTNTVASYSSSDVNMDGIVKYVGQQNDRDPILVNIGGNIPTTTIVEQLP